MLQWKVWGRSSVGTRNGRCMVKPGSKIKFQCTRNVQHSGTVLHKKDEEWGSGVQCCFRFSQGSFGLPDRKWDHDYCGILLNLEAKWKLNLKIFRMIFKVLRTPISISLHQGCHISCQFTHHRNQTHSTEW